MLQMISKSVLLIGLSTALSGCLLTRNPDFNEAARDAATLFDDISAVPELEADELPSSGEARYVGIAALNYEERLDIGSENNDYLADISFDVSFEEDGEVEGQISNVQSPDGAVGGTLDLQDGEIFANGVNGDFVGELDDDGTSIFISMDVNSDFHGDGTGEPSGLLGTFSGEYESDTEEGDILGSFAAEFERP